MKIINQAHPRGQVIFCDDIRGEVGNKVSLIGVYSGSMSIPASLQFPLTLPKLGIAVYWDEPIDNFSEEITFKASYVPLEADPNEEDKISLVEFHQNLLEMSKDFPLPPRIAANRKMHSRRVTAYMILSPFVITHPGKLRVRAYRSNGVWTVGALAIEPEQPPT